MATVKAYTNVTFNMGKLDFSFLNTASFFKRTESAFEGIQHKFTGKDLHYDSEGMPDGGTFTGYLYQLFGNDHWSMRGVSIDAAALVAVAQTNGVADDKALLKLALSGNDKITGANMDDVLYGYDGKDTLIGNTGSDRLYGGDGNDTLIGGGSHGNDKLYGGEGADKFVFKKHDSQAYNQLRDTIFDFSHKEHDKIDLHLIDANTKNGGNQAFKFIGQQDFHDKAGELRYEKKGGDTFVYGDTNGDGKADLAIKFDDPISFVKGDFML